jgi:hypothetical protein
MEEAVPKPVWAKMGIKRASRAIFVQAPAEAIEAINPPELTLQTNVEGDVDYIHLFVNTQAELNENFPTLKASLRPTGMLWVSWPKGGKHNTDLTLTKIIEIGYNYGLVESKVLSINATWSAIKFTFPKPDKVYQNSYGTLKA